MATFPWSSTEKIARPTQRRLCRSPLKTCGGALSAADIVGRQRNGPRRISDCDDDDMMMMVMSPLKPESRHLTSHHFIRPENYTATVTYLVLHSDLLFYNTGYATAGHSSSCRATVSCMTVNFDLWPDLGT